MKEFLSKKLLPALMTILLVVTSFFAVNTGTVNAAAEKANDPVAIKTLENKVLLFNGTNCCTYSGNLQYQYHTTKNYIVITHISLSVFATESALDRITYMTPKLTFTRDDGASKKITLKKFEGPAICVAGPQDAVFTYRRYWDANEKGNEPIKIKKKNMSRWTFNVGVSAWCSEAFIKYREYTYKKKLTY